MQIFYVMYHSLTKFVVVNSLSLAHYVFFSGSDAPGGGFVGGLVLASSFVLLFLAFDIETIRRSLPVDFKLVGATGTGIVVLTGLGAIIFGEPFLTQTIISFTLPVYGDRKN